jgi:hypothetical protein
VGTINTKYPVINNEETTPNPTNYDSIDFSGNLLLSDELKPSTSLKDGRMKDEQENITQEIILYMVSIMALIAVLLFLHHVVFVVIYNNYEIRITK